MKTKADEIAEAVLRKISRYRREINDDRDLRMLNVRVRLSGGDIERVEVTRESQGEA